MFFQIKDGFYINLSVYAAILVTDEPGVIRCFQAGSNKIYDVFTVPLDRFGAFLDLLNGVKNTPIQVWETPKQSIFDEDSVDSGIFSQDSLRNEDISHNPA